MTQLSIVLMKRGQLAEAPLQVKPLLASGRHKRHSSRIPEVSWQASSPVVSPEALHVRCSGLTSGGEPSVVDPR